MASRAADSVGARARASARHLPTHSASGPSRLPQRAEGPVRPGPTSHGRHNDWRLRLLKPWVDAVTQTLQDQQPFEGIEPTRGHRARRHFRRTCHGGSARPRSPTIPPLGAGGRARRRSRLRRRRRDRRPRGGLCHGPDPAGDLGPPGRHAHLARRQRRGLRGPRTAHGTGGPRARPEPSHEQDHVAPVADALPVARERLDLRARVHRHAHRHARPRPVRGRRHRRGPRARACRRIGPSQSRSA